MKKNSRLDAWKVVSSAGKIPTVVGILVFLSGMTFFLLPSKSAEVRGLHQNLWSGDGWIFGNPPGSRILDWKRSYHGRWFVWFGYDRCVSENIWSVRINFPALAIYVIGASCPAIAAGWVMRRVFPGDSSLKK